MRNSKILFGISLVTGVIGIGILVGWWGSRAKPLPPIHQAVEPPLAPVAPPPPVASTPKPAEPATALANAGSAPAAAATNADWEDQLDNILGSDDDDTNKVQQLFALFPTLSVDGQEEVAQHLSNLVPDDAYAPLAQLLQNTNLADSVLDVLMSDLLNRPNSVKLPQLLQIAQNPGHPKADEAKDLMELYLDEENPAKWPEKMQEWLKENPD